MLGRRDSHPSIATTPLPDDSEVSLTCSKEGSGRAQQSVTHSLSAPVLCATRALRLNRSCAFNSFQRTSILRICVQSNRLIALAQKAARTLSAWIFSVQVSLQAALTDTAYKQRTESSRDVEPSPSVLQFTELDILLVPCFIIGVGHSESGGQILAPAWTSISEHNSAGRRNRVRCQLVPE